MRKQIFTAFLFTLITTFLLGIVYPLGVTVAAHFLMPYKADGQLIARNGVVIGSKLIGQSFTGPQYFDSRPSAAGAGYDAANSSGSNLGPTNATLIARVRQSVWAWQKREANGNSKVEVPVDLVTTSASGLDPDISVVAAEYQIPGIARARGLSENQVERLVRAHIEPRQFGVFGEPRVNVLELNLALERMAADRRHP